MKRVLIIGLIVLALTFTACTGDILKLPEGATGTSVEVGYCADDEGSDTVLVKGRIEIKEKGSAESIIYEDKCVDAFTVAEHWCAMRTAHVRLYECPNGCLNGVCT